MVLTQGKAHEGNALLAVGPFILVTITTALSLPRQPDQTEARSLPGWQGQAGPLLRLTLPVASYSLYLTLKLVYLELKYFLHVRKSPRFTPAALILSHQPLTGCTAGPRPGREGGTRRLGGRLRWPLRARVRDCPAWVISLPPCRAPETPFPTPLPTPLPTHHLSPTTPWGLQLKALLFYLGPWAHSPSSPHPVTVLPTPSLWFFLASRVGGGGGDLKVSSE